MGVVVLDTSAVAAFLDIDDVLHDRAEASILAAATERHGFAVSMITWAELMVGVELGHYPDGVVRGLFKDMNIAQVPVTLAIAEHGAQLRSRFRLKLPDALVLATADLVPDGVAVVTGDRAWTKVPKLKVQLLTLAP
jgi:predicted nucleic acid-binding protein